jgi:pyruvate/2-oxoglutarate dehydrogenase complex dihydrolipoamide acyltransferase (E2) component
MANARVMIMGQDLDKVENLYDTVAKEYAETLPMPYVARKANEKAVKAIHTEIRSAQAAALEEAEVQIGSPRKLFATRLFALLPGFLRKLILGIHSLIVAVGSITRKPGVLGDAIEIREFLSMTVLFDHDVIDGAPVARFVQRLKELLETCYGLDEIIGPGDPAL